MLMRYKGVTVTLYYSEALATRFTAFREQNKDMSKPAAKEMFIQREQEEAAEKHREGVSVRTLERALKHAADNGEDVA